MSGTNGIALASAELRSAVRTLIAQGLSSLLLAVSAAACVAAAPAIELPNGKKLNDVDFDRHVVPLLSRFGCNAAACHGSFQGRGGMQLSLFGHSPEMDFEALSARVDTDDPPASLALLKPTATLEHGGGVRFEKESWPYRIISRWIEQGGNKDAPNRQPIELSVDPPSLHLSGAGMAQLRVQASFGDNRPTEDVTPFCRFMSGDSGLVTVDERGNAAAVHSGATHIVVEYLGGFATVPVAVPFASEHPFDESKQKTSNAIDAIVQAKLKQLNLTISPPASDYAFLRRVTLDVVGRLPTVNEIHDYTTSDDANRREDLIERLLQDDRHAALWATRFCDITRLTADLMEGPDELKPKRAKMWHDWFRVRIQRNEPYHEIVRGWLCAASVSEQGVDAWIDSEAHLIRSAKNGFETDYADRDSCDLFWRRISPNGVYPTQELAEVTASALVGMRIQCAQCHKHPYDRWTQADYRSYVNVFSGVQFGSSTELSRSVLARIEKRRSDAAAGGASEPLPRLQQVYFSEAAARPLGDLTIGTPLPPRPLGGPALDPTSDPRDQLMDWLITDGRPQFAAAFVNRVWAHYFGRGIVEPVDGFSAINPPSHPELLDALADEFIESGYDTRQLERSILLSKTYQRSAQSAGNNAADERHYGRAYVRPLLAEVAIDVVHQAIGAPLALGSDLPPSAAAIEIATDLPRDERTTALLQTFGRTQRRSNCDCDRAEEPSLRQTLFLMSDEALMKAIDDGRLRETLMQASSKDEAVETLFLTMLSRNPMPDEFQSAIEALAGDDSQAWTDLIWALINTREFLTNH